MNKETTIKALVLVSNSVSAAMANGALKNDGYDAKEVFLIKQRKVEVPWSDDCAKVIEFGVNPSLTMIGQFKTISYYLRSVFAIRQWLKVGDLRDIYLPNIDNIISNHLLQLKRSGELPEHLRLSVVAEGFMNYQDIKIDDRAKWRWAIKPIIARILRLRYRQPDHHLSGSYEPEVSRVFSYSVEGIKAPSDKVVVIPYPTVEPKLRAAQNTALVVMTGIGQWMQPERFEEFKHGFADWLNAQKFERVLIKHHPYYPSGGVENLINNSEIISDGRRLEEMASEIPTQTVVGYCTTGLVILKLMRPDLTFIDWGSDFYCEHAYHGDRSIINVLRSAGIEIVN